MRSTQMDVKEYSYFAGNQWRKAADNQVFEVHEPYSGNHAPMGGVRDSGWGRTGPRSLDDFSDVIWINSHSGQRQYPF